MPARDEISLPEDWQWDDDWQVDLNRAVDEEGRCNRNQYSSRTR